MKAPSIFVVTVLVLLALCSLSVAEGKTPEETYQSIRALRKEAKDYQAAAAEALEFLNSYPAYDMVRQKIHYEYAAALFDLQNFVASKQAFESLVTDYANTDLDKVDREFLVDDAQFFAAMIEESRGDKAKAAAAYKALVDDFPQSNWRANVLVTLGGLERDANKPEDSLAYYYRVVKEYPDSKFASDALFWANRVLITTDEKAQNPGSEPDEDNSAEIKKNIDALLQNYAGQAVTPEAVFDLINYHHARAEFDQAKHYCEVMFEKYPTHEKTARSTLEWVEFIAVKQRYAEAVQWTDAVLQEALDREDLELYENAVFSKGCVLIRAEALYGAIAHLYDILATYPDTTLRFEINFRIAACYYQLKEYDNAIQKLQEMLAENPKGGKRAAVLYTIGSAYHWAHDFEKAKEYYQKVLDDHGGTSWAEAAQQEIASAEEAIEYHAKKKAEEGSSQ